MTKKTVLVAGASGLVGYAAIRQFLEVGGCEVIAVSRRRPANLGYVGIDGARFIAADLTDAAACAATFGCLTGVTHVVYAALHERPGLVAGWREAEQIAINDAMLRNLLGPLERASPGLRHVSLLQGTKAYGVHVRPIPNPAREGQDTSAPRYSPTACPTSPTPPSPESTNSASFARSSRTESCGSSRG